MSKKSKTRNWNVLVFIFSIASGLLLFFTDVNKIILKQLILKENATITDIYLNPPVKIMKLHVFNYTNIDNFMAGIDSKLKVEEIGPFTYEETVEKIGVQFEGSTLSFYENRTHKFIPELSTSVPRNATVITPNTLLISAIPNVYRLGSVVKVAFSAALGLTQPKEFDNITINEFLHGYTNPFISAVSTIKWNFSPADLGFLVQRSGVSRKNMTVNTGAEDVNVVGRVTKFGGLEENDIWKSEKCNRVDASDGIFFGPKIIKDKADVEIYVTEIVRSLPLSFVKESRIFKVMRAYYYEAPEDMFHRNSKYHCESKNHKGNYPDGLLDISACMAEPPPAFMSHPHFIGCEQSLFDHIEGLKPNKSRLKSFAYVHPRLSVPMGMSLKLQMNLQVFHYNDYYKKLPEGIVLPLAWFEVTNPNEMPAIYWIMIFLAGDFADIIVNIFMIIFLLISVIAAMRLVKDQRNV